MAATIIRETPAGADHEVGHGTRDEHLSGLRCGLDTGGDVGGDATDIIAASLDLTGVRTDSNLDSKESEPLWQLGSTPDRSGRPVEGCKKPVAGRLDLAAPVNRTSSKPTPRIPGDHARRVAGSNRNCQGEPTAQRSVGNRSGYWSSAPGESASALSNLRSRPAFSSSAPTRRSEAER